jgi:DNA repair exonuclease SbcCD ATPase subunit
MTISIRSKVDEALLKNKLKKKELVDKRDELNDLEENLTDHKKVREVYQQAALATQSYIESHISSIVTNALQSVFFEKDLEFKVVFDKKRNSTECNLYILEDGDEYEILDDKGFGVADISSFALRVAYILLDSVDNVLIMDEPFRNLDKDRTPYASRMVAELSKELDMQFIISTHIDDLTEAANKVIRLKLIKKDTTEVLL